MEQKDIEVIKSTVAAELEAKKADILTAASNAANASAKSMVDLVEEKVAAIKSLPSDVTPEAVTKMKTDVETLIKDWADMEALIKKGRFKQEGTEGKMFNESFGDEMKECGEKLRNMKKGDRVVLDLKDMQFGNSFPTAGASVTYVKPGIIELPKRKLHIRELLQGGSMGANSTFNYVKEITGTGAIANVQEATLKPQFGLKLQEVSVFAEWIAGFLVISRNMLDDIEGSTTFLQSRLPELLLRAEDAQILNGNGVRPNLLGIQSAGNYTAGATAVTNRAETLVNAISQLENLDREANGILVNPADWYTLWLYKGVTSGEYTLPVNLIERTAGGGMVVAGVPVFRSTAQTFSDYLVGDWTMGANLITREPARVEFFYEDGTNARTNQVTVRIEERLALPVYGNDFFIYGTFDAIS